MAELSYCCLCSSEISVEKFNLQDTVTSSSKIPLLTFIQSCIFEEFIITSYLVCEICYHLLDELDGIKSRAKAIEDRLKNYLGKYFPKRIHEKIEIIGDNNDEECTVCLKRISSEHFKSHLKEHSELNALETNFDFDEVGSISAISPTLDDIHLSSSEETEERNNIQLEIHDANAQKTLKKTKRRKTNDVKPYNCAECPKTWKTLSELKNHMSAHSTERPYICEICGQAYKRQQALTVHVGMHKGINPFTCVYCKKSFTQKGALMRHTPIHTGELPFQCDLCGKRFVHHTSFNIHKLSHTGEKSYKCEICGFLLISGSHLKRHMKVHTGEKKFNCNTCGRKFAEKYNLAVHEKLHVGVSKKKKYQCHICSSFCGGQVKLEQHLLNVHQRIKYSEALEVS